MEDGGQNNRFCDEDATTNRRVAKWIDPVNELGSASKTNKRTRETGPGKELKPRSIIYRR